MRNKANPTLIGAFVLSALLLGLGAVLYLGGKGYGKSAADFILYFEEDVRGLRQGSPVTLRGVKIGQVKRMTIHYDQQTQRFSIPVIISIDPLKLGFSEGEYEKSGREFLDRMIADGLRAQLNAQSLVTGMMEVEMDFHPGTPVHLSGEKSGYAEIPTIPSQLERLSSTLDELPLERMVRRLTEILDSLDRLITGPDLPALMQHLVSSVEQLDRLSAQLERDGPKLTHASLQLLGDSQRLLGELNGHLAPLLDEWRRVGEGSNRLLSRLEPALDQLDQTLVTGQAALGQIEEGARSANALLRDDSPVLHETTQALRELAAAARSIRGLAEYLERHPEALLRGKQ